MRSAARDEISSAPAMARRTRNLGGGGGGGFGGALLPHLCACNASSCSLTESPFPA